jgi:hypothetical protein
MPRALWQLLLEDSSDLTCEECFALMEYYAETLTSGRVDLLPEILEHLEGCPDCELQHRMALRGLISDRFERSQHVPWHTTRDENGQRRPDL